MTFFDATNIPPDQGGIKHPIGSKFPAQISGTCAKSTKDNDGGYLCITFTTPAGNIDRNYNFWNKSEQAVDIARKQLSALCHAIGIYALPSVKLEMTPNDFPNAGRELRGARCQIDVSYQKGQEPSPEKPSGGFVEVSKVYDANGNEPGRVQAAPQPQAAQPNPGAWNNQPPQQPAQQLQQQAWPSQPAPQNNAPGPNPAPVNNSWQQGPSAPAGAAPPPPWATGR